MIVGPMGKGDGGRMRMANSETANLCDGFGWMACWLLNGRMGGWGDGGMGGWEDGGMGIGGESRVGNTCRRYV